MNIKPREKLEKFGPEELKNSELISIILGHASKKEDVFTLSKRILSEYGNTPLFSLKNVQDCMKYFNIGKVHASKLIACFEIGRRFFCKENDFIHNLKNATEVYKHLSNMKTLKREYMHGIYLNTKNEIIHEEVLSLGTIESATIHIRDVFTPAFINHAYSIIIAHNHPSGDPSPSRDDIYLTKEIEKASILLGIKFLDHIIVSQQGYFSFNEENLLYVD